MKQRGVVPASDSTVTMLPIEKAMSSIHTNLDSQRGMRGSNTAPFGQERFVETLAAYPLRM